MSSTLSSSPTYAKSSRTLKVNPILYSSPLPTRLNGILLYTPSCVYDRFSSRSTGAREEARGLEDDKREAWKRRRKKHTGLSAEDTPESPPQPESPSSRPESPPDDHRSLRPKWVDCTCNVLGLSPCIPLPLMLFPTLPLARGWPIYMPPLPLVTLRLI